MRFWISIFLAVVLAACGRGVVPAQSPTSHTNHAEHTRYDSVYHRDSTIITRKNDTIIVFRDRWRDKFSLRKDTIFVCDTVSYTIEVPVATPYIPRLYRWSLWIAIASLALIIRKIIH